MKKLLLFLPLICFVIVAEAQTKKPVRRKTVNRNRTVVNTRANQQRITDSLNAAARISDSLALVKKADSIKVASMAAMAAADTTPNLGVDSVSVSLRNDNAVDKSIIKVRVPLEYEYIREDNAVYRQKVWRVIDTKEKMNSPFNYNADDDNGNQRFISILLTALKKGAANGGVDAFNPIDDRFTTPYTYKQIAQSLVGKPRHQEVPDWAKDPDGSKGIKKDSIIIDEFDPSKISKFELKEEVVFSKQTSRMFVRVLGIAPLLDVFNDNADGTRTFRYSKPVFWVYYPDLRGILSRYEVFNPKNSGARMTWEDLFESRMFSSYIVKTTLDNPQNKDLLQLAKEDHLFMLLQGEKIKEKIFNYEQDLWQY
ncbi:MAG: gliding motility protein GldN [Bacteroidota bacterium]|nr:gliding motility protein GldN [Bacteroidota bacterium]